MIIILLLAGIGYLVNGFTGVAIGVIIGCIVAWVLAILFD